MFCCFWFLTMRTGKKAQCGPLDVGKKYFFMTIICDVNNSHEKILFSPCRRCRIHTVVFPQSLFVSSKFCLCLSCPPLEPTARCHRVARVSSARFPEPQPLDDAGLFSYLTLSWLSPLMVRGLRRSLDEDNIPQLSVHDAADKNAKR